MFSCVHHNNRLLRSPQTLNITYKLKPRRWELKHLHWYDRSVDLNTSAFTPQPLLDRQRMGCHYTNLLRINQETGSTGTWLGAFQVSGLR